MATSNLSLQGRRPRRSLKSMFKRLIALEESLEEQQITLEHIIKQRKEKLDPDARYVIGSGYGGYTSDGLNFITLKEYDRIELLLDEVMQAI